jgi:uncharacterized protein YbjT (DUF2867 family)
MRKLCLVIGSTGYVGGRLVPRLLNDGHRVRCLVRNPDKLRGVPWADQVEIAQGDVFDDESLARACEGVDALHYLVHSLAQDNFAERDRHAARMVAEAARNAVVDRIIYLGGLHPDSEALSDHLGSRAEVGEIFLRSGVPTVALQAAVIIGSGSASFEILRYLTERLPVMVTPRWVHNHVQPIAVRDVLHYLTEAVTIPGKVNRTFDIGGPDVLTYAEMMQRYAALAGLPNRRMLPIGVLSPRLSSHWINIVTPVPKSVGAPLIESLIHKAVCGEHDVDDLIAPPSAGLTGYDRAVELARGKVARQEVESRWSDASPVGAPSGPLPSDPDWAGGKAYVDVRERHTSAPAHRVWAVIEGIGGHRGWYSFPLAWSARGWIDRLGGGVGLRRGRRHADQLRVGDALDWWRVEELDDGRLLRLRAEMKVPGLAWLELSVDNDGEHGATYRQRAIFVPSGLAGHLYWWSVAPFHGFVFGGMVRNIVCEAEQGSWKGTRTS